MNSKIGIFTILIFSVLMLFISSSSLVNGQEYNDRYYQKEKKEGYDDDYRYDNSNNYYSDHDNRYNYLSQEEEYYDDNYHDDYCYKTGESEETKLSAIHNIESGKISEINTNTFSLELQGVPENIILFSDTSHKITKSLSTQDFVDSWNVEENNFGMVHLNGFLIYGKEKLEVVSIELFNPVYDSDMKTLKYEITSYDGTSIELPDEFGQSSLVIDIEDIILPCNIACINGFCIGLIGFVQPC